MHIIGNKIKVNISCICHIVHFRYCVFWPYYRTMRLGFAKSLGKIVAKYVSIYTKGTLKKKKKKKIDQQKTSVMMLMRCFCIFFFWFSSLQHMLWVLIWIASTSWCKSNGYLQHMPLLRSRQKEHWQLSEDYGLLECVQKLTLVLLNPDISCFANSVDPDQLASSEANWSGSALFAIKYANL